VQVGGGEFPSISIDVSQNGQYCFDTVIQVRAQPVPISDRDADGDGVGDLLDNCSRYFNPEQKDVDGNGIGDVCECGDQNGDGTVNVQDLIAINRSLFSLAPPSPLCDTNYDDLCNVQDIIAANRKIYGQPAYCSRYPPPVAP
jgi:hypothetical protein